MDRKEVLPPLPEIDSPPMSPKKQLRPIKTMDSYNSQEGRSVEELKVLIKKVLQSNYQAFEEVRFAKLSTTWASGFLVKLLSNSDDLFWWLAIQNYDLLLQLSLQSDYQYPGLTSLVPVSASLGRA